jgi:hypothetical protein
MKDMLNEMRTLKTNVDVLSPSEMFNLKKVIDNDYEKLEIFQVIIFS